MTTAGRVTVLTITAVVVSSVALAQDRQVVTLTPKDATRWDVAGHVGWFGGNKSDIGARWDQWYGAASGGASAGFYWTAHLKTEFEAATTTKGTIRTEEQLTLPGSLYPFFYYREHRFRETAVAAGIVLQLLENRWVHPFIGAGAGIVRETEQVAVPEQFLSLRPGGIVIPAAATVTVSHRAQPYVTGGVKLYVSERAFIRTDVRAAFSSVGAASVVWRGGVGVDF